VAKYSLTDSPTATHCEVEAQLTALSGWGVDTSDDRDHGFRVDPVRIMTPWSATVPTEVPTATQVLTAVQETSANEATDPLIDCWTQLAPPLAVVRITPWPERGSTNEEEVVPTAVHRTPATPTTGTGGGPVVGGAVVGGAVVGGAVVAATGAVVGEPVPPATVVDPGRAPVPVVAPAMQEIPLSSPVPAGMGTAVQLAPPLVVRAIAPLTAPAAVVERAVTQQSRSLVQATPRAPVIPAGRAPACVQPDPVEVEMRAASPMPVAPMATHRPSVWQVTAEISSIPGGVATCAQVCPPSTVSMMTAWVVVDWTP
jgi:hypothetical protein